MGLDLGIDLSDPSGSKARRHASQESKKAYARQRQMVLDTPALHVQGLEKAGLNRILAAGGVPPAPNVGSGQTPQHKGGGASAKFDMEKMANIDLMQSTGKKEEALAEQAKSAADGIKADAKIKKMDAKIYEKSPMLRKTKLFIDSIGNALPALIGGGALGLTRGIKEGLSNKKPKYKKDSPKHYRGLP